MSSLTKNVVYQICPTLAIMKSTIVKLIPGGLTASGKSIRERALRRAEAVWKEDTIDQTVTVFLRSDNGIVILLRA